MSVTTRNLTFCYEEVQQRQRHRVTGEHVIAARPHALNAHAQPAPDGVRAAHALRQHFKKSETEKKLIKLKKKRKFLPPLTCHHRRT